jgi:hypothetical protein
MFTNKFKLFSISLIAVWVVLLVKNVDIPIYFGTDAQFVGFRRLLTYGNFIAFVSAIMIVIALLSLHQLNHRLQGSPDTLKNTLTEVGDRSVEYVNVLATVVTLISVILVPTETLRDFIVFLLLMTVISICFMRTNLYYSNPLFAVLGYHIYTVGSESNKLPKGSIAISRKRLAAGDKVVSYHISDNVYSLEK